MGVTVGVYNWNGKGKEVPTASDRLYVLYGVVHINWEFIIIIGKFG